jgi:predicted phage terminase large subunit-like protein
VKILLEQEPGSAGKTVIDYYTRRLMGYPVRAVRPDKKKEVRAAPFASACEAGHVRVLRGRWLGAFLDEAEAFPDVAHDDQVDAASGAFAGLVRASGKLVSW